MTKTIPVAKCGLCGEPMSDGEQMFNYHGYSGPCPKPPLIKAKTIPVVSGQEYWINDFKIGPDESITQSVLVDTIPNAGLGMKGKTHVATVTSSIQLDDLKMLIEALDYSNKNGCGQVVCTCVRDTMHAALTTFREKYVKLLKEGE